MVGRGKKGKKRVAARCIISERDGGAKAVYSERTESS